MTTLVDFSPTTISAFQFQPTLNGTQYSATIFWNIFSSRYYLSLSDLQGNLIVYDALTSSGPSLLATFAWKEQAVTATTSLATNVPVGVPANIRISQTNSGYDGFFLGLSTGPNTMTYPLPADPQVPLPQGNLSFPLNLVQGYLDNCFLFFYDSTQQFEYSG